MFRFLLVDAIKVTPDSNMIDSNPVSNVANMFCKNIFTKISVFVVSRVELKNKFDGIC